MMVNQVAVINPQRNARRTAQVLGAIAILFGILTIVSGGRVLFGDAAAQSAAGAVVPFVLWFNFVAGFAYVAVGIGLTARMSWAAWLSVAIAAATMLVFAGFGLHVWRGGAYEPRTVGAMALRSIVWIGIAITVSRLAPTPDTHPTGSRSGDHPHV